MSPAAAGVGENQRPETGTGTKAENNAPSRKEPEKTGTPTDTLRDKCSHSEENLLTGLTKSGSNKSLGRVLESSSFGTIPTGFSYAGSDNIEIEDRLARSCEDSKAVDNRMLDPDAMIESLDRFTAELVSQASHLNKDDDKYKISTGDNTWNEDTSPNEVTFPSISGSAPNVITFSNEDDSNKIDIDAVDGLNENNEAEAPSNDFSSVNTSTMTESTLIALEATKMACVFKNEAEMSMSITSATSLELDHVQPPSHLNSLTNSAIGLDRTTREVPSS
ncbi:hypothetical protein NQ318_000168 [Aromia moschata]|uniref:Uncharacterized protein n=1 Tax=Aromia moschata TaxID=1265417 RepID=A0AAV8YIS9_9CUCU|nr:hypothetical protein NQ318_000168 [Aromia moschata]